MVCVWINARTSEEYDWFCSKFKLLLYGTIIGVMKCITKVPRDTKTEVPLRRQRNCCCYFDTQCFTEVTARRVPTTYNNKDGKLKLETRVIAGSCYGIAIDPAFLECHPLVRGQGDYFLTRPGV